MLEVFWVSSFDRGKTGQGKAAQNACDLVRNGQRISPLEPIQAAVSNPVLCWMGEPSACGRPYEGRLGSTPQAAGWRGCNHGSGRLSATLRSPSGPMGRPPLRRVSHRVSYSSKARQLWTTINRLIAILVPDVRANNVVVAAYPRDCHIVGPCTTLGMVSRHSMNTLCLFGSLPLHCGHLILAVGSYSQNGCDNRQRQQHFPSDPD